VSLTPAARRGSALIDEYEASGLGLRAFARQRDINPSTLSSWRSKLGRTSGTKAQPAAFTELVVGEEAPAPEDGGGVQERGGLVVRLGGRAAEVVVDADTDLELLRRVVDALC
jgi:transposase-like protein